ncbi:MAG TPA: heparinase II/III family protein [Actinocatenispora sp.]
MTTPVPPRNSCEIDTMMTHRRTLTVGGTDTAVTADVADLVGPARATGGLGFMLMARYKGGRTIEFHSGQSGSGGPTLTLTLPDGTTRALTPTHDTYIANGPDATTVFGTADVLQVRDEGTGPYADTTRKAYLWFDLAGLPADPTAATLRLVGRTIGAGTADVLLYQEKESFDEATRTWANTVQNTFSWQGDPAGFDWRKPAGADNEYGYQLPRFYFAGPIADAYAASADERQAAGLIGLMLDFIADADSFGGPAGAGSFPRKLDAAARFQNWTYAYEILRGSESLTPQANAAILKTVVKAGRFFTTTTSTTPNWMITIKSALLYLGVCFPELADAAGWRDNAQDYLTRVLTDALYPDGGYVEASSSYAMGVAQDFVSDATVCQANGIGFEAADALGSLAWFLADQTYPNGFDPAYGDSSYGDQRDKLATLAELLDDDGLRFVATGGAAGRAPDHTSVAYRDTRVAVQRTGWRTDDCYLRFNADRGAHSHPDELAVQVYVADRPLLPAMGAFTYSADPKADWLRTTTRANNTIEIDGTAQDSTAAGAIDTVLTSPWLDPVTGWTDGTPGVRHTRTVLFVHQRLWLVGDRLDPADTATHAYEQAWHLLPDADPVLAGGTARTRFAAGTNPHIVPARPDVLDAQLRPGYYSRVTYEVTEAPYVSYTARAAGPLTLDTALLPVPPGDDRAATLTPTGSGVRVEVTGGAPLTGWLLRRGTTGSYGFDGTLGYVDTAAEVRRILVVGGTSLTYQGNRLVESDRPMGAFAARLDPAAGTVELAGTVGEVRLAAPWARRVTVNGAAVPVSRSGGLLTVRG